VPNDFIFEVFDVMNQANWHVFQVLTKRSERLKSMGSELAWADNIWAGVTVETSDYLSRIDDLRACGSGTKFLSLEPLLGPLPDLDLEGIDWVIVGGESGPGARPMNEDWVVDIRDQCMAQSIPFFFKQWGGVNKKKAGRLLQGRIWGQMPALATPDTNKPSARVLPQQEVPDT